MDLNLNKTVYEFLVQHPEKKFKARQIAEWILKAFPAECEEKKRRSKVIKTDALLVQQIVAEIGAQRPDLQKKYPNIKTTESRPRHYYWTSKSDDAEVAEAEATKIEPQLDGEETAVSERIVSHGVV